ncbi:egg cell-secreted protein 1.2-like [Beta vulgaris subsp. vulgaris]|uniref:egg cell-secreted protein 1.2-like n=1 Tax=Beta vulgaris subsp. vulgaris TaxID=3555 RepID=UPI0020370B38|nr:egg cell-secreted protein 1.2-like [Beta vulgaris subsp. vulgaris]
MAFSVRIVFTILVAFTICFSTSINARPGPLHDDDLRRTESRTLVTRLNLDGNSTSCWDSLFKLQSCSGELIQFFYNGQTYLGPDCCNAVFIIVHDCWPAMLGSLGFTSEEGDILRGYCDAVENTSGPKPPSPPHASGPIKDGVMD